MKNIHTQPNTTTSTPYTAGTERHISTGPIDATISRYNDHITFGVAASTTARYRQPDVPVFFTPPPPPRPPGSTKGLHIFSCRDSKYHSTLVKVREALSPCLSAPTVQSTHTPTTHTRVHNTTCVMMTTWSASRTPDGAHTACGHSC